MKFGNYLYMIPGVNGMPLSYAVRAQAAPDHTADFQDTFIAETIACAPLSSAQSQVGTRKVHHLLKNYLVNETAEQWISSIKKSRNSRNKFDALRRHCSGESNVSRRVATEYCLQQKLH